MARAALIGRPRALPVGRSEVFQDLLRSTLIVAASLPPGQQVDASRPCISGIRRDDVYTQPLAIRQNPPTAVLRRATDLGRPNALRNQRGSAEPQSSSIQIFGIVATTPKVGQETGSQAARLIAGNRAEPQGTPFALFPPSIAGPYKNPDFGRPAALSASRGDAVQNLAFLPTEQVVFSGWEDATPNRIATPRFDPTGRNYQLYVPAPTAPAVGIETGGGSVKLRATRAEPQGSNLQLFVQAQTSPPRGLDIGQRPIRLQAERTDVLGSPYGLIQQSALQAGVDFGRPSVSVVRRDDALGTRLVFQVSPPFTVGEFGRPAQQSRQQDYVQQNLMVLMTVSPPPTYLQESEFIVSRDRARVMRVDRDRARRMTVTRR